MPFKIPTFIARIKVYTLFLKRSTKSLNLDTFQCPTIANKLRFLISVYLQMFNYGVA